MSDWDTWIALSQADLTERNLRRGLRALNPRDGLHGTLDGRDVVIFSSNDYLGLSSHPAVREAFAESASRFGAGPRAATLVCGYTEEHAALEADLADLTHTESALVFPTGYAANLAVLTALADPDTAIFSDAMNHASIVDGCRMARGRGATVHVYRHADLDHLEELLATSDALRKLIVTDSVFSMDGDIAPLRGIAELRRRFGALVVVDEAHALLVFGEEGGGAAEELMVEEDMGVRVGTLGKAIGAHGGFVATSRAVREHILNRGRSFIYSTALPVPVAAAARAALRVFRKEPGHRDRLDGHRDILGQGLGKCSTSAIQRLVLGEEQAALRAAERLLEDGWLVPAIRPPTVPRGTSRLRITLSAGHRPEEVEGLVGALRAHGLA